MKFLNCRDLPAVLTSVKFSVQRHSRLVRANGPMEQRSTVRGSGCGSASGDRVATMSIILAIPVLALAAVAGLEEPAADARRGSELLEQKRCLVCHSVNGAGGSQAADLARRPIGDLTPSLLASAMWNHAPAMWRAAAARDLALPELEPGEVAHVFAYFYSLRYSDPPGDAARGKVVFISSGCSGCHASSGVPGPPDFAWRASMDPMSWTQRMWNHTSKLTREVRKTHTRWPRLSPQQMADLMAYGLSPRCVHRPQRFLSASDPVAGESLFDRQGCARCHSVSGGSRYGRMDLLPRMASFHNMTEFAATMWNHAPEMRRRAERLNADLFAFQGEEMGDLLAYLFEKRDSPERGEVGRGARIYRARHCGVCHDSSPASTPGLMTPQKPVSALSLISALHKHRPQKLAESENLGIKWPLFTEREVRDLISYLNRDVSGEPIRFLIRRDPSAVFSELHAGDGRKETP